MRLRHPLIHHGPAAAADQVAEPSAQESMLLVGHQRLTVLPAQAQIVVPAVLAPLDWDLIVHHVLIPPYQQHTIPQKQEIARVTANYYQKIKPRSLFYCLTIQNIPEHSPPIYTILTPKPTTWSPDKSPRSGRFCRSDLGPSCAIWGNSVDINNYFHDISLLSQSELPMLSM